MAFRAATPACVRRRSPFWGEGCRVAPMSSVQRQLEVEPCQHVQQEVPIQTHMGIDEWRQRLEIFHSQPCDPGDLTEYPLQHEGSDIDQGILEQMQREHC